MFDFVFFFFSSRRRHTRWPRDWSSDVCSSDLMARFVFTHIATPAALLAIIFGTLLFVVDLIVSSWLMVKLTLVTALVLAHASSGILVLRLEKNMAEPLRLWCWILAATCGVLMLAIVWVVLAKPTEEVLPWIG